MPDDFKDFLGNSENKELLRQYLAEKFVEIHSPDIVTTYKDTIKTNDFGVTLCNDVTSCYIAEADQRIIRHVLNCTLRGISSILVCTG